MKKFFLAVAALAMLATSCTKDETTVAGGESLVSFTIDSPELATRAYGDGTEAKVLYYAFYEINGEAQNLLTAISATGKVGAGEQPKTLENGKATINVHLVDGRQYAAIFWAQNANAPYTIDWEAQEMSYNPNVDLTANNEAYDAFYAYYPVTIEKTHKVTLTRPFAQINIATAQDDLDNAANAGLDAAQTKVTVNAYKTLDLVNGDVKNPASFEFDWAAKAEGVAKTNYPMLAMNYVLVYDRELVNVTMEVRKDASDTPITRTYSTVPVQRNYQTFIIGNLLTTSNEFNVEVEEDFNETTLPETEAEKLIMKMQTEGGEFTLPGDITLKSALELRHDVVLNMEGHTITGAVNVAEGAKLVVNNGKVVNTDKAVSGITSNGDLTLNNVEIESARHAVRVESGKVVINGGTYKVAPISNSTLHALNVGDNNTEAEVIINGGTFIGPKGTMAASGSAVNVRTGSKVTINGGNFSGGKSKTLANGGTLTITGGTFDQNPTAAWVATGYQVIEKDGKYVVVANDVNNVVENKADLKNALEAAKTNNETNVVIDAAGANIGDLNYGLTKALVPAGTTVTIRNANVEGRSYGNGVNGTVIFEDCTFNNSGAYSIHFDNGTGKVIFKNCDLYGWNSFGSTLESVEFEGCTLTGNGTYALIRSYVDLTLTDCVINTSNANHDDAYSEGVEAIEPATLTENNVTYVVSNPAELTAALEAKEEVILLNAGVYEGTFHVLHNATIKGNDATIKGRVHINSANATFENVKFDRNETNSNEPNNTASNALQYKAVVMIYGDQTNKITFNQCEFYNNNGTHKSAITNVACDLVVTNCYFEGYSSSIYSQANLSVTNSEFNYTGGNNVILSINGCGENGGKVIFKNNKITNRIFALSQFLSTVGFGNGTYHFDVQGNTGAGFDHYFLNGGKVANKTFAEGSETF